MTIEDAIKHCRDTALSNAGNAIAYLKGGQKMMTMPNKYFSGLPTANDTEMLEEGSVTKP